MVSKAPPGAPSVPAHTRLRKRITGAIVIASFIYTIVSLVIALCELIYRLAFKRDWHEIIVFAQDYALYVGLAVITEGLFIWGAIIAAKQVGSNPIKQLKALGRHPLKWYLLIKDNWRSWIGEGLSSPVFFIGLLINWVGALGTGVVWLLWILLEQPSSQWVAIAGPLIDIFGTMAWRVYYTRQLKTVDPVIRVATVEDVAELVAVDSKAYDDLLPEQTDNPHLMWQQRVVNAPGWLLVATRTRKHDGLVRIRGMLSLVPTPMSASSFTTWDAATGNGTLKHVYVPGCRTAYAPALTSPFGDDAATVALMAAGIAMLIRKGVRKTYFCARMPKYADYAASLTPEEYVAAKLPSGKGALDPLLREFDMFGFERLGLKKDAWPIDTKSGGHGMLYCLHVPFAGWPGRRIWAWLIQWAGRDERVLGASIWAFKWLSTRGRKVTT